LVVCEPCDNLQIWVVVNAQGDDFSSNAGRFSAKSMPPKLLLFSYFKHGVSKEVFSGIDKSPVFKHSLSEIAYNGYINIFNTS